MSTSLSGLAVVQNLYLMQVELQNILEQKPKNADALKQARRHLREFSKLLKEADAAYMGGEDVYESLCEMETIARKALSSAKRARKKS